MRLVTKFGTCAIVAGLLVSGCSRAPVRSAAEAMRPLSDRAAARVAGNIADDLPIQGLIEAIEKELPVLKASQTPKELQFGPALVARADYIRALERFSISARNARSAGELANAARAEFDFFEVYGSDPAASWGDVFITSYYEPVIPGSLNQTERFSQALYSTPGDLIALDLAQFEPSLSDLRKMRGRLEGGKLVPYYSREDIDGKQVLRGRKLEICWVDPVDAFFLQVQGSATIDLGKGRLLRVNYAEKNGQPYEPIGKFLKDRIPLESMNLATIETYLRTLAPAQLQQILNKNPSYVFFHTQSKESALTYLGVPASDGRTIATDRRYFPKGALGLLIFNTGARDVARFVLDQDIGGAIQGPGRVDLFWGRGEDAKRHAGVVKTHGRLYYLVPKARNGAP